MTEANLAPEANRPDAISYKKGCYLGQEPIARIDALGHVNRLLCRVRFEPDSPLPTPGTAVTVDGIEAGTVTSSALSHNGGDPHPVALALLKAKFAADGTAVEAGDARGFVTRR